MRPTGVEPATGLKDRNLFSSQPWPRRWGPAKRQLRDKLSTHLVPARGSGRVSVHGERAALQALSE